MKENMVTAVSVKEDGAWAVKLLDRILARGYKENASDIHLEPRENRMAIRMRIDGLLVECMTLEKELYPSLITRAKILAGMDIAEKRLPQDGHFHGQAAGIPMNLRVSTIPTVCGEKAVLRFLNRDMPIDRAETFGMSGENYRRVLDILKRPGGIFYITGPTGSGKTTTLYMILERLLREPVNIVTIEDPVEKNMDGICQMQVNKQAGLTFDVGLRAALRQDPDIIMVGETRDGLTAKTSVRAAITGHLVLSTLHTNDAVSAVIRMMDMGVEPYLTADSLNGVLSQRLVRKVCPQCAEESIPDEEEQRILGPKIRRLRRGRGCAFCRNTGYKGRIAVHEVFVVDREVRRMIVKGSRVEEIGSYARDVLGLRPLKYDILDLVEQGVTTVAEFMRVAGGE